MPHTLNLPQIFFQSERLLNPCIISVVEKSVVETPQITSVDKEDDVTVEKMDVDVEEEKVDDCSLEIVKSILEDLVLDVTRPPLEEFIGSIIMDMVKPLIYINHLNTEHLNFKFIRIHYGCSVFKWLSHVTWQTI